MRIQPRILAARPAGILACVAFIGGCSLGNPYVARPSSTERAHVCAISDECTAAEGKLYAYALASRYHEKLNQHARMESTVGAGGIVLGSIVLALAASDANVDAFKAAGVLGATGYGLNTWYSNKPREEIYAKGMVALSCAVSAIHPLALPRSERDKLTTFLTNVGFRIDAVNAAAARLLAIAATGTGTPDQRALAATMLQATRDEIDRATASIESASKLDSLASVAGNALVDSVDRIEVAVDDALRKTVPEGTLALQIAGSLGDLAAKVVPGLKVQMGIPPPASAAADSESGKRDTAPVVDAALQSAMDALQAALAALRMQHAPAIGVLGAFSGTGFAARLDACAALGLSMLSVAPNEIEFTQGTAASASAVIDHGKPPYSATPLGPSSKGIEVKSPLPFDRRLDVAISKDTLANRYPILVSDANGRTTQLTLIVKAAAANAPTTTGASTPNPKPAAEPASVTGPITAPKLLDALKTLHGVKLEGGKYEIESFVPSEKVISVKLVGDAKIADPDERSRIRAQLGGRNVAGLPLDKQLETTGMTLKLPQ